ncbi:uncharacterized protein MYCFIDRAFT_80440 [Pseudocercospora fijiensis CIRAD86]|uniref:non-specific serine/threonine protein kinase n=1 Tax=Pseudocercospora fijiensis (strain CIRAD86) TaxID=383855 RepID=M2YYY5_PSEFD|nr:uncharacterized protein MYCFIDRAFT_80440 [Pseudocercospora fijiensis CIRAD86]EME82845.1 hypothetical protein MYCFIDRAFT_80440 [Pseudocercospora fijiensis CIRAD86]
MSDPQYVLVEPRDQERYVNFELEARRDPETDYEPWEVEFEPQERNKLRRRWLKHAPEVRSKSADAYDYYLDGKKGVADAENDVEVASRYRGAADDEGDEIGGRPRFEYFEERQKVLAGALDGLRLNIVVLRANRVGKVNDAGDQYCTILMERNKEKIEKLKKVMEVDIPALRKQAKKKLQVLGKRKRSEGDDEDMPPDWDIDGVYESYKLARADLDLDSGWYGGWLLGRGSYGEACLWVQLNDDGKVGNRVVVKESLNSGFWTYEDNWTEGSDTARGILTDPYSTNMGQAARAMNWVDDMSSQCIMLPEAFCWHALETFALAGLLMQRGKLSRRKGNMPWEEIIHRDIKPENVFIGVPSTSRYPGYPELKLGDFGLAFVKREWDKRRPRQIPVAGTPHHQAPEQLLLLSKYGGLLGLWPHTKPMTAKTNVWAFGIVLWGMIQGKAAPADGEHDFQQEHLKEPAQFDATAQSFYSKELLNLVRACTRYNDEDRPSFDAIMKKVLEHTTRGPNERARGLRDLKPGQLGFDAQYGQNGQNEFVLLNGDDYRTGCSLEELPPLDSGLMPQAMPADMKELRLR